MCQYIVFSRSRHDFRRCKCESVSIDGGFDYNKVSYTPSVEYKMVSAQILDESITKKDLYNDWNKRLNIYGCHFSGILDKTSLIKEVSNQKND